MWTQLLAGKKPAPPPKPPVEEEPKTETIPLPREVPPKEVIDGSNTGPTPPPPQLAKPSSGFFEPPKLPPSPRALARKQQQETGNNVQIVAKLSENTANLPLENATGTDSVKPSKVSTEPSPDKQSHLEQVVKGTWSPPLSPRYQNSSPEKTSPEKTTINSKAGSPFISSPGEQPKDYSWRASPPHTKNDTVFSFEGHRSSPGLDTKEARICHADYFKEGIAMVAAERRKEMPISEHSPKSNDHSKVSVFIRKRPFVGEDAAGDFDVVRAETASTVVVYNTHVDLATKTRSVKPITFKAAGIFDEKKTSADVYYKAAKPLVEKVKNGGIATLLMFGQTGTGKSHTISTIEGMMARDIYIGLPTQTIVKVSVIEICGGQCSDLLDETPSPVRIADNDDCSVRFVNARLAAVTAPENLQDAIVSAKKRKQTSNLSHVVCRVMVVLPTVAQSGILTLVDCAGTEKRNMSRHDNRDHQLQCAEINANLWALKECIRAKTCSVSRSENNVPYDYSSITRILRQSLESEQASFNIIATISPKATDTESTIETLISVSCVVDGSLEELMAEQVMPADSKDGAESIPLPPKGWDHSRLCEWMIRKHLIRYPEALPSDIDGRKIMKMSKKELQGIFYGNDFNKADLLFRCLRAETDRLARLDVKRRMAVERARAKDPSLQ